MTVTIAPTSQLDSLVSGIRSTISTQNDETLTAQLVADQLRQHLLRTGHPHQPSALLGPDRYRAHILHVEPDGSFSILVLVRGRQVTRSTTTSCWPWFALSKARSNTRNCSTSNPPAGRS
jgi:hypothetical protein